jgi:hypothetical protein
MEQQTTELPNGVLVINTSPHPFVFDGEITVPPSGTKLNATFDEVEAPFDANRFESVGHLPLGVNFVTLKKNPTEEGLAFLASVPKSVLVIGSIIAAEAYGFPVVAPVPTPETAGRETAPADKRMRIDTFTVVEQHGQA